MGSIWDAPVPPEADASAPPDPAADTPSVPTVDPRERIFGTQAGPLFTDAGRGVKNGVPYGETEQARLAEMNRAYLLRPSWAQRLVAATRAALGR